MLGNCRIVISKLVNRRTPLKSYETNRNSVNFLAVPLCSDTKRLLGKFLLKKKQIESFYTINGNIKIKYDSVDGECKTEISYAEDLVDMFGTEVMPEMPFTYLFL